jgi:hypothetical protein
MLRRTKEAVALLAVAERLRLFALETADVRYSDRFRRGADQLEIEAVGCAASDCVAHALRAARAKIQHQVMPC